MSIYLTQTHKSSEISRVHKVLLAVVCGRGSSRAVESESMPALKPLKQQLHGRRWGQRGPAAPIALEHDPGLQPSAHGSQRNRPGHSWLRPLVLADFFPLFLPHQQEHLLVKELPAQAALEALVPSLQED